MKEREALKRIAEGKDSIEVVRNLAREALAQPKQKPVAWLDPWTQNNVTTDYDAYGKHGIPLYTTPPKRTWVGLTDEEANELWESTDSDWELMKRTEVKLKEKNT